MIASNTTFDTPIVLIFFNRPSTLKSVFNQVREIKPKQLFLVQDGCRENNDYDNNMIQECRKIVENIDWDCEVYKNYSDVNLGCGVRPHTGISWVFNYVDKAIILEDDCIPESSFFFFCSDMLIKYEKDLRVGIVCGFNYFGNYDFGKYSYGFVKTGSIWGWATWKNRWEKYDYSMSSLNCNYVKSNLSEYFGDNKYSKKRLNTLLWAKNQIDKNQKVSFWDYQWGLTRNINSWFAIMPKTNLISNVGIGVDATHSSGDLTKLPNNIRKFYFSKTSKLNYPLEEPDFIIQNHNFDYDLFKVIYPSFFNKLFFLLKSKLNFKKLYSILIGVNDSFKKI